MIATLEFSLPEEQTEFLDAARGAQYRVVLNDVMERLRSRLKYEELSDEGRAVLERFATDAHEIIMDSGLDV